MNFFTEDGGKQIGRQIMAGLVKYAKENLMLCLLILLELILFIVVGSGYTKEKYHLDIPYTELIGTTIPDDRDGWYIDETFPCMDSGLFDYTEDISLKRGTYDITVRYEADIGEEGGNTSTVTATTKYYQSLRKDVVGLPYKLNEITYSVFLLEDVEDFRIEAYYGRQGYLIIKGFSIQETRALLRIELFMLFLVSIFIDAFYIVKKNRLLYKIPAAKLCAACGVTAIGLLSSLPAFADYYVRRWDTPFHMLRIEGIKEGLLSGQFPVKMQPGWLYGYGYPVSVYYGDLFLYPAAILRLIGFPVHTVYNILLVFINLATAAVSYISFHKLIKDRYIALMGSLLYTLVPYRIMNMYNRGGLGEVLAVIFLPLIIYGFYAVFTYDTNDKKYKNLWIPLAVGFTGIIQSHVLTCVMCALFIIPVCIIKIKAVLIRERFFVLAKTVIYTALLNIWFIFPFLTSMEGLAVTESEKAGHIQFLGTELVRLFNLLYPGTTNEDVTSLGHMTLGIGLVFVIPLFLYLALCAWIREEQKFKDRMKSLRFLFWLSVCSLYLATIYFPWDFLAELLGKNRVWVANIEFPWRFLELSCVFLVLLLCMELAILKETAMSKWMPCVLILCAALGTVSGMSEIDGHIYGYAPIHAYDIEALGTTKSNVIEYLIAGTDIETLVPEHVVCTDNINYSDYLKNRTTIEFTCENTNDADGYMELPLLWYKEYTAYDAAGEKFLLEPGNNNVIRVSIPGGYYGTVTVEYRHPVSWRIAEMISLLTLAGFVGAAVYQKRKVRITERG